METAVSAQSRPERCMYMLVCPVRAPEPLPGNGCTTYISCPRAWQHSRPSPHSAHLKVSFPGAHCLGIPLKPSAAHGFLPCTPEPSNSAFPFPARSDSQLTHPNRKQARKQLLELGECTSAGSETISGPRWETSGRMWSVAAC